MGGCGSLWIVVDRCGSLWVVVDRCGSLWLVPGFSNYVHFLQGMHLEHNVHKKNR